MDWPYLGITLNKLHWFVTPMDIYPYAKKELNNSNFFWFIRISRILESDWLRPRLGMSDQTWGEWLNPLVGSSSVLKKKKLYDLIVS